MGIEVTKVEFETIKAFAREANDYENKELEVRVQGPLDELSFNRAVEYYTYNTHDKVWTTELDIFEHNGIRTTIKGLDAIHKYAATGVIDETAVTILKQDQRCVVFPEYGFKIAIATEKREVYASKSLKKFRLKHRFCAMFQDIRVDLTIVKTNMNRRVNMVAAKINDQPQQYEAEVEYVPRCGEKLDDRQVADALFQRTTELIMVLADVEYVLQKSLYHEVLGRYKSFASQYLANNHKGNHFIGPSTSTLKCKNIETDLKRRYSVTHKANGERTLIFATGGQVYTINNRMTIKKTGLTCSSTSDFILDAEFISLPTHNLILLFDCYLFEAVSIGKEEHFLERHQHTKQFHEMISIDPKSLFNVEVKQFVVSATTWQASAEIFMEAKPHYDTDGYIYTPIDSVVESFGRTWDKVFKWKKLEDNTIDFLVHIRDQVYLELFVGAFNHPSHAYMEKAFVIGDVHQFAVAVAGPNGTARCVKDGHRHEEIQDGMILEMAYFEGAWQPLLIRYDKTERYRSSKSLAMTANNEKIALDTWELIQNPITADMLVNEAFHEDRLYYAEQDDEENIRKCIFLSPLKVLHNRVKLKLIESVGPVTSSLLDIACGRGGDLHKWKENRIRTVVGIDLNVENVIRAYGRLECSQRRDVIANCRQPLKHARYIFLPMDASKMLFVSPTDNQIINIQQAEWRQKGSLAWGISSPGTHDRKSLYRLVCNKFDTISCQFAIHYFFRDNATLDCFLANVDSNLKVNGMFIGTCFDGDAVAAELEHCPRISQEDPLNAGSDAWYIVRKYDTYDATATVGVKIGSYIATFDKEVDEYLVPFHYLVFRLANMGIVLENTAMFETDASLAEGLQRLSKLNRWFKFKKIR